MPAWLDPQAGYLPITGYEQAHDVGRWWDAILRLEHATGFSIPAHMEDAMLANLKRLTDYEDDQLRVTHFRADEAVVCIESKTAGPIRPSKSQPNNDRYGSAL